MSYVYASAQIFNAPQHLCIQHLLRAQAELIPDAPAVVAPDRAPLTYGRLRRHIDDTVRTLQAMGLDRNDRIAVVLPSGPEMAVAFLAVAASSMCAPLNPAYSANEFDLYFADLNPKALIMQVGIDSPARVTAQARGLPIIELLPLLKAEAGLFTLTGEEHWQTASPEFGQPSDVALMLHTAGTTSRPKIVPLTHINICTVAHNYMVSYELKNTDICLNLMPFFHAHGLLAALLTSLMAGASIVCSPSFSVPQFFVWLAEFRPTWYTAVPAIHQAILARAALHAEIITRCPLRFIRSASAPLPPRVLTKLESMFNTRMIEIYGATEVSGGAITCNPLPPHKRKIGSVGMPAGPEIAIMDGMGTLLPVGEIGEIVVRGATVMQGYYNNPLANRSAFTQGWFRTGDQGYIDIDGYLFITGRLKEIINRGGEKIAPREVEEILMEHPAIAEVIAFAVPHTELGEDIAVAIVVRKNASVTAKQIREFASVRLASFKVPSQVVFVDEIPKGATGKVQRIGLAQRLGFSAPEANAGSTVLHTPREQTKSFVAPRTSLEVLLAEIWQELLEVDRVGVYDNFFDLGGTSLLSTQIITRVEKKLGLRIHPTELMLQTLGQLASACEAQMCPSQSLESMRLLQRVLHALKGVVSRRNK